MKFTHLHTHSHYSLLDGLATIDKLLAKAKKEKMEALALTDHGVMYGAIEFYQKAKKAGIKPIIGVETYVAPNGRKLKRSGVDDKKHHLILLAKDIKGYKNLIKLTSQAHLEGFYYKPRVDFELLEEHHEGLIAMSACLQGEVPFYIMAGKMDKAREAAKRYQELFGADNYYLELQHHPEEPDQVKVNEGLIEIAKGSGMPLVATNDIHYLEIDDSEAHDVLLCLQTKRKKEERERMCMLGGDYSLRSADRMIKDFSHVPEAIENTQKIVDACNLEIELGKITLPHFDLPKNQSADEHLEDLCIQGIEKRYTEEEMANKEFKAMVEERLKYELSVIAETGYASYFLIVQDFVNWAKDNSIVVGPGRGSAAGSLVSYLCGITNIAPLKYDLIFERFLNPERISMPDIDLDFADIRRDEVIRYVEKKYGQDHVAQIITFGTMAARAVIRDVGRVLGLPYTYCDKVAKLIPMFTSLDKAISMIPELQDIYNNDPDGKGLIDTAKKLEGVARHASTHACGVVITKDPLTEYVPLQYASSGDQTIVSQYSLHPIEDLGLLKMDFLGLKNLTILENTIEIVEAVHKTNIEIDKIPLEDDKTFTLLKKGETTGVFQLESSGMKRYLKELKPTEFEDIIAMVALYRPGPMDSIPDYISAKHGRKGIYYLDPCLKPILEKTHGVIVYQEQVFEIARQFSGFTYGQADILRKAVGKKIKTLLDEQRIKFIDGAVQNGKDKKTAQKVWDFIEPFAQYGFNKSHAACYAMIAYQTAYLKASYPVEFMASLLTADEGDTDRIAILVEESHRMGIEVLPPEINESFKHFSVVPAQGDHPLIRFGLLAVKNLGENVVQTIIAERKENGPYKDLVDFLSRVKTKDLNKKSLESLIKSGTLDNFGERNQLLVNMEQLLAFVKDVQKAHNNGQTSLFDSPSMETFPKINLKEVVPATDREKLSWEKELLGLYITEHPFREYEKGLSNIVVPVVNIDNYAANGMVNIGGVITKVKKIITRSNEPMLFVKLEDTSSGIELIVFPSVLKNNPMIWQEDKMLLVQGKISDKDGEAKLLVNQADEINDESVNQVVKKYEVPTGIQPPANGYGHEQKKEREAVLVINLKNSEMYVPIKASSSSVLMEKLKNLFEQNRGDLKVYLEIFDSYPSKKIETPYYVNFDDKIQGAIEELVEIKYARVDRIV